MKFYQNKLKPGGYRRRTEAEAGPPKILEKTSQSEPHPLDLRKSWKKPHNSTDLLVVVVVVVVGLLFRQAVQRPPAGPISRSR